MVKSDSHKVLVPNGRDNAAIVRFSAEIAALDHHSHVEFSFRGVDFVTPGWMLLIVRALQGFRDDHPGSHCKVVDATSSAMIYAGHAGFFDALGLKWGRGTGEAPGTSTFLPVSRRKIKDIFANQPLFRPAGDIIQADAESMSAILAQGSEGVLFDTLSYAIREIIRNVVEHSRAQEFLIAAQCWVASGTAEIAIADSGIGIAAGLSSNGKYSPRDDEDALLLAIRPGVSGAIISRHSDNAWANSGYGLYMAQGLADGKQGFVLASGTAAITSGDNDQAILTGSVKGTCVVLRLRAGDIGLDTRLANLIASGAGKPSRASVSAKVK
ncbi:ATP-binding protein [Mesorhizobium sp. M0060]|uniref:ATP-binding protein n=1 Tax=Mesorhizobium sp. M0060 TaxID=2956866 RepID=UPI00333D4379